MLPEVVAQRLKEAQQVRRRAQVDLESSSADQAIVDAAVRLATAEGEYEAAVARARGELGLIEMEI